MPLAYRIVICIIIIIMIMNPENRGSGRKDEAATGVVCFVDDVPPVRRVPNALARRFFQICTAATAESVAEAGLMPLEFAVMTHLSRDGGEPDADQRRLAAMLGIDRNSAGLLVERLEHKGLVTRRINAADRRARMVRLTTEGERLLRKLLPKAHSGQQRLLDVLKPAEREMLLDLLLRVIEGNRALARPGAGRRKRTSGRTATKMGRTDNGRAHIPA